MGILLRTMLYLCLITWTQVSVYSQPTNPEIGGDNNNNNNNFQDIIPPSPNAASLGKYLETPVSMSTGIPNISVPIYNITEGSINVPVSISYHAGGIKVEEYASWVGLSWSLNAGGMVSRIVCGLPDDCSRGYIHTQYTIENLLNLRNDPTIHTEIISIEASDFDPSNYGFYNEFVELCLKNRDFEPDIFQFNFPGYSGRFIYNQRTGSFMQTPYSNIKIDPIYDAEGIKIVSWIFTTPDGMKYYFGISDNKQRIARDKKSGGYSYYKDMNGGGPGGTAGGEMHFCSWHLMDIVSPENRKVSFTYDKILNVHQFVKNSETYRAKPSDFNKFTASFSHIFTDEYVIESIEFTNGKVVFVKDEKKREDLENSRALKSIKIYKRDELWKSFALNYDYFVSKPELNWPEDGGPGDVERRRYRLKLTSVEEYTTKEGFLPPTSFEYSKVPLPARFSNAQDFWGYYNGKDDNINLIPRTHTGLSVEGQAIIGDADRSVDPVKSQACMLTKITYPTGGSAEYFYESNTVSETYNFNNSTSFNETNYEFVKSDANKLPDNPFGRPGYADTLHISDLVFGPVTGNVSVTGCDISNPSLSCDYELYIESITDPDYHMLISSKNFNQVLIPGYYRFVAYQLKGGYLPEGQDPINPGEVGKGSFSISLKWLVKDTLKDPEGPAGIYPVGGHRISKILLNDAEGNTIQKSYKYNLFNLDETSGYMLAAPIFKQEVFDVSSSPSTSYLELTSYSQAPLAFVNGSITGYRNVTEYVNNKIKTEYEFSLYDLPASIPSFSSIAKSDVFIPIPHLAWAFGNLKRKTEYKLEKGAYKPVKKVYNIYEKASEDWLSIGLKYLLDAGAGTENNMSYSGRIAFYIGESEWYRIKSTETTNIIEGKEINQLLEYVYDNNPMLASSIKTTDINGDAIIQRMYYPEDVMNTSSLGAGNLLTAEEFEAIRQLKSGDGQHRIAVPLQISTWKQDNGQSEKLLSTLRTLYKVWGFNNESNGQLILPKSIQSSKGSEKLNNKVVYHSYDAHGNPTEVSTTDSVHISYLWGYNNTLPVAKITGASYGNALESLAPTNIAQLQTMDGQALLDELNGIREGNSGAMVNTYTYDPLSGKLSETGPNNTTTTYVYDSFGRLKEVKDNNMDILKSYKYHYNKEFTADFICDLPWVGELQFIAKNGNGSNYKWAFDGGTIIETTLPTVNYQRADTGILTVSLTITDQTGYINTKEKVFDIQYPDFDVEIKTGMKEYCAGPVLFTAEVSDLSGKNIFTYKWELEIAGTIEVVGTNKEQPVILPREPFTLWCLVTDQHGKEKPSNRIESGIFSLKQFSISAHAQTDNNFEAGTITLHGGTSAICGETSAYTIDMDKSYHLSELKINGEAVPSMRLATIKYEGILKNIEEDMHIEAYFEKNMISGYVYGDNGVGLRGAVVRISHYEFQMDESGLQTGGKILILDGIDHTDSTGFFFSPISDKTGGLQQHPDLEVEVELEGWEFTTIDVPIHTTDLSITGTRKAYNVLVSKAGTCSGAGTVRITSPSPYLYGEDMTVKATADISSTFSYWETSTGVQYTQNSLTMNVAGDLDLQAHFDIKTFTVAAATSSAVGTVLNTSQTVNYGSDATINIRPGLGYYISEIRINGEVSYSNPVFPCYTDMAYKIEDVKTNKNVEVYFSETKITGYVYDDAGAPIEGASLDFSHIKVSFQGNLPSPPQEISDGYAITGTNGYFEKSLQIIVGTGEPTTKMKIVPQKAGYNFTAMEAQVNSASLSITGNRETYTVTINKGGTGSGNTTPASGTSVRHGDALTATAIASSNSTFTGWSGSYSGAASTVNLVANGNISLTANFIIKTYTISASTNAGGTITSPGTTTLNHGSSKTYSISLSPGYIIKNVQVNGVSKGIRMNYVFDNVQSNQTISVVFEKLYRILTVSYLGVDISPFGISYVQLGGSITYSILPKSGYRITNVYINNVAVGQRSSYTFTNVTSDQTIRATAELINTGGGPGGLPPAGGPGNLQ